MAKKLGLIGVPTSMGAFAPGQEKGPEALREADLLGRLSRAGVEVVDHGDGGGVRRWRPDKGNRRAQNLPAVVEVVRETAGRVGKAHAAGHLPLVVGGDCTIELGTVAGLLPPEGSGGRLGLIYFDVHPDLNVPASVGEGALDWMGMAHMLGEEGAAEPLSQRRAPLSLAGRRGCVPLFLRPRAGNRARAQCDRTPRAEGHTGRRSRPRPGGRRGACPRRNGAPLRPPARAFRR